jgi:hypothetical protein
MDHERADDDDVTGYVCGKDAKAQESDQVNHARDYAEQGRKPLLKLRERRPVIR